MLKLTTLSHYLNRRFPIFVTVFLICFCFKQSYSQTAIDLSRPVVMTAGEAGSNGAGAATYSIPIEIPSGVKGVQPGISITDTCNIIIRYFRASGELGGNNEAFDFERSTTGSWKCKYIVYKKNTYGLATDSASIDLFYKRNLNDIEIVKEFRLTAKQYNFLKHLIKYFINVKLEEGLYSNAGEHYYITINGKNLYINDKGRQLNKTVEMRKRFVSNTNRK